MSIQQKIISSLLFVCFFVSLIGAVDPTFELWNKRSRPVYYSLGNEEINPLLLNTIKLDPKKKHTARVDISQKTRLFLQGDPSEKAGVLFEISPKKTIYIALEEGLLIRPQKGSLKSFGRKTDSGYSLAKNVKSTDIILLKDIPYYPKEYRIGKPYSLNAFRVLGLGYRATSYDVLDVRRGASKKEIEFVCRQLALKWHPDKNPQRRELATEVFKLIRDAYEDAIRGPNFGY